MEFLLEYYLLVCLFPRVLLPTEYSNGSSLENTFLFRLCGTLWPSSHSRRLLLQLATNGNDVEIFGDSLVVLLGKSLYPVTSHALVWSKAVY